MSRLSAVNDSFLKIIMSQNQIASDMVNMKQLLYSQTDFATINKKIANLENLLRLYSTNQIGNSESITAELDNTVSPPNIKLTNVETQYNKVFYIKTSLLYNLNGSIPYYLEVPNAKTFLIYVENDDVNKFTLPNNDKLRIVLNRDLDFRQTFDLIVDGTRSATENKQLEVYVEFTYGTNQNPIETQIIETIDLPVYYNSASQLGSNAVLFDSPNYEIDLSKDFTLNVGGKLEMPIREVGDLVYNYFKKGDVYVLDGFTLGTQSLQDFSSQYIVDSVGITNSYVYFDVNNNLDLINYGASASLPLVFNVSGAYLLSNKPKLKFNKGSKYKVTRINESNLSEVSQRYLIEKAEMMSSGLNKSFDVINPVANVGNILL
jgi:hypothetical protein